LKDQRELLKCLVDEQVASQKQYDQVLKRLELLNVGSDDASMSKASIESASVTNSALTLVNTNSLTAEAPISGSELIIPSLPAHLHDRAEEIFDHCRLINAVIEEVNHAQYKIDLGIRYRTQELILDSHYNEWAHEIENRHRGPCRIEGEQYGFLAHAPQLVSTSETCLELCSYRSRNAIGLAKPPLSQRQSSIKKSQLGSTRRHLPAKEAYLFVLQGRQRNEQSQWTLSRRRI
jgi:hypothetical protein